MGSLGNGLLKLLTGPAGTGKTYFLYHDFFNELSTNAVYQILEIRKSMNEHPANLLSRLKKDHTGHTIVLIDDIFAYDHPESVFDVCSGRSDIDIIATSDLQPSFAMGKEETLIRGRYQNIPFLPVSLPDSLDLGLAKTREEYLERGGLFIPVNECLDRSIEEGRKIKRFRGEYQKNVQAVFHAALNYCDMPISYRELNEKLNVGVSRKTIVSYLDLLKGVGVFHITPRENVRNERTNSHQFVLYPMDVSFKGEKRKRIIEDKTMILSKLVEESYRVSSGYVYGKFDGTFQALDVAFVLRKGRDKIYLSYGDSDGSKEAEVMARFLKDSYLKIVVVPIKVTPWKDGSGILHMGLEHFLRLGLSEFAGGQAN